MADSETAHQPPSNNKEAMQHATRDMFVKVSDYVQGEVAATSQDYKLLEAMHAATTEKFQSLTTQASSLSSDMGTLQQKTKELQPVLDQVDVLEASVSELHETANMLDAYSKRVEAKYKDLMASRHS
uniref:Biogenesis of lysosome-related organelles complex 1 subunit 2 n=2 Tax=Hemiselmis andersenii TaxID=464988 RepID=A0A6U2E2M3_HEMAN